MLCRKGEVTGGFYSYYDCCGVYKSGYHGNDESLVISSVDFDRPFNNVIDTKENATQTCPTTTATQTPTKTPTPTVTPTKSPTPTPTKTPQVSPKPTKTPLPVLPIVRNYCDYNTIFPLEIFCDSTNASSTTSLDGIVGIIPNGGGTQPYTYTWNNGGTSQYLYNVSAGTYTVNVRDSYGDYNITKTCTVGNNLSCEINADIILILPTVSISQTQTPTMTPTPTNTPTKSLPLYEFTMNATSLLKFTAETTTNLAGVTVIFGDGATTVLPPNQGGPITFNHTYTTPYTGLIKFVSTNLNSIKTLKIFEKWVKGTDDKEIPLIIKTTELSKLTSLYILNLNGEDPNVTSGYLSGDTSYLPSSLTYLYTFFNNLSGDIANLPSGLRELRLGMGVNLTGEMLDSRFPNLQIQQYGFGVPLTVNLANVPRDVKILDLYSRDATYQGDIGDLPPTLTYCHIFNEKNTGTITGDINNLPTTIDEFALSMTGNSTVNGSITTFPTTHPLLKTLSVAAPNTISGNLSNLPLIKNTLINLEISYGNTISGSLPNFNGFNLLQYFIIQGKTSGQTNISGTIDTIYALPKLIRFVVENPQASVPITGTITTLPNTLQDLIIIGKDTNINLALSNITTKTNLRVLILSSTNYNTITGNLSQLPPNVYVLGLIGKNLNVRYSSRTWANQTCQVILYQGIGQGLSRSEMDNLLSDILNSSPLDCLADTSLYNISVQASPSNSAPYYSNTNVYNGLTNAGLRILLIP